jgi:hypothetical protein
LPDPRRPVFDSIIKGFSMAGRLLYRKKTIAGSFECHHWASGGFQLEAQERRL